MAWALSLTLLSSLSTRWRKLAMALSMTARRPSSSCIEVVAIAATCCSVMSAWVATQPPSPIGRLVIAMKRPSSSRTWLIVLPLATLVSRSAMYWSRFQVKFPILMRWSIRSRSETPGVVSSDDSLYI